MKNGELKQEAKESKEEGEGDGEEEVDNESVWDCGSPLYDSFELASLCHQLDRHLMLLPFTKGSGRLAFRPTYELDEFNGETIIWRGKKEEVDKKKSKVGLRNIYRAIAFWRKL